MKLSLAFSPCPNDTFIFDALIHGKIAHGDMDFDVHYQDVQELNTAAKSGLYDITKLSYNAASKLLDQYQILDSGGALGFGCGPLLIAKQELTTEAISSGKIAIPGLDTTAYFLLTQAFPNLKNVTPMLFSTIEDAVLNGEVDAGLIIHENRFTYEAKGLVKIMDLGEYWEKTTGHPIPLGCIAVRRSLPEVLKKNISKWIKQSVEYAWAHPGEGLEYIRCHSQEMAEEVIQSHIKLYVNEYSASLGQKGKEAVMYMFEKLVSGEELKNDDFVFF